MLRGSEDVRTYRFLMFLPVLSPVVSPFKTEPEYLGLYAGGRRIGFAKYTSAADRFQGEAATRQNSETRMTIALQGEPLKLEVDSTTYTVQGKTRYMKFVQRSGGRTSECVANFGRNEVQVELKSDGKSTKSVLARPDGPVVDDPITLLLANPGASAKPFYVLDPTTGTFVRNVARRMGVAKVTVGAVTTNARRVDVEDPRMTTTLYLSGKGDLVKATTPIGIDMLPLQEKEALAPIDTGPSLDLASATSIVPDKALLDAPDLTRLRLKITNIDLKSVPSGTHQSAKAVPGGWIVDVKPPVGNGAAEIGGVGQEAFTKPSAYIASGDAGIAAEARKIIGSETRVLPAAQRVRRAVYRMMTPNAGIGVLRDAREVLRTKEGVCRDYAVLTAALCRAAGIPTRLATGLVTWDGTFYYHAWCEVWDGKRWIGLDSAAPGDRISAGHVKLSEGNVDRAFVFPVLGRAKVQVLAAEGKKAK